MLLPLASARGGSEVKIYKKLREVPPKAYSSTEGFREDQQS